MSLITKSRLVVVIILINFIGLTIGCSDQSDSLTKNNHPSTGVSDQTLPGEAPNNTKVTSSMALTESKHQNIASTQPSTEPTSSIGSQTSTGAIKEELEAKHNQQQKLREQINQLESQLEDSRELTSTNDTEASGSVAMELVDLIEIIEPAVVIIHTDTGIGSGFVISRDGLIVTNQHVIEGAENAQVTFRDGTTAPIMGLLFVDDKKDIAVAQIDKTLPNGLRSITPLDLAKSPPRKGETVVAFGAPDGLSFSATEGIVSAVRPWTELKALGLDVSGTWIQTTAPISNGSSGGPLVNLSGQVIGVNTFVSSRGHSINFAISATDLHDAAQKAVDKPLISLSSLVKDSPSISIKTADVNRNESTGQDVLRRVQDEIEKRLQKARSLEKQIVENRNQLKTAMLDNQITAQKQLRSMIRSMKEKLLELSDWDSNPVIFRSLDLFSLRTGESGHLGKARVEVLQVVDTDAGRGYAIVIPLSTLGGRGKAVILSGIDLSSVVTNDKLFCPENLIFKVTGTVTYKTVAGSSNTVFALDCILNTRGILEPLEEYSQIETEPQLTAAERLSAQKAKRPKIANSKLLLAKQLLATGKLTSAKKWLQELVDDYPDTPAGKEAGQLLKDFPKR